ncbi:hypothetical protein PBV87_21395 [Niameybacter massiliensis]|uniref:Uncharacterized protein n=1 Tax=Holtiella tumoricola TaxID=3018743 RepID=A0AA42DRL9_9FIRM|nr:hypothetical protein [Holtiella tumoricola]MDA3734033.1 hypothetical protein [Holtiella tumoricola]
MVLGEREYKLILLDTNAIREIITNTKLSGKGFFEKFFCNQGNYAPCFFIYNVIELMPYADIFEKFIEFFSTVPCLMFFPIKIVIHQEYQQYCLGKKLTIDNQIAHAFTPIVDDERYNCKTFFSGMKEDVGLVKSIQFDVKQLAEVAKEWEKQRNHTEKLLKKMGMSPTIVDEKFYLGQEYETIIKDMHNWEIKIGNQKIDIKELPTLRIMEYAQFNRVYLTKKKITPNDVMDIRIGGIIPYMDAVITENFQANIYKKAKKYIPQMKQLEIYTLKDIRLE